ncbi:MAG: adenylate/guanylate cyclase domain-containing protein [Rhodospirillaceae bacterium]|nr:adenylate/guanylate cyclase domain-containing protein [Rhodospirillaceae bacterium]
MRDDAHPSSGQDGKSSAAGRVFGGIGARFAAVPWRNALSGRWWWRWFQRSWIQSGRLTVILALVGLLGIQWEDPNILQIVRARVFDLYQQTKPRAVPENSPVVIIDIDEKSLREQGQWPWPRTIIADFITKTTALGVGVIGFDVTWPEADGKSMTEVVKSVPQSVIDPATRARIQQMPSNDHILAEAIAASGKVVLGQSVVPDKLNYEGKQPLTSFAAVGGDPKRFVPRSGSMLRPLPILDEAAAGRGAFSLTTLLDGIVRQVPMIVSAEDNELYPSLSLEMLRVNMRAKTIGVVTDDALGGISQIFLRPPRVKERYVIKTDGNSYVYTYFRPYETFRNAYISISDILNDRVPREKIEGKLALVGTSAIGLQDLRSSPVDQILPGVEVHANILENILFNMQLTRPVEAKIIEILTTAVVGLLMVIIVPLVGARIGGMTFLAIAGGLLWYSWNAFSANRELYDPSVPLVAALAFYFFLSYAGYAREEAQRKQVRSAFGQYLSPALVQKLAEDPTKLTLGGENKEMTFMFSDVRGFTSISELFDAQGLTRLINRLLTPITNVILSNNGTIDKYMGDCVMAFWNAPLDVKDHAASACRAALKMIDAVHGVNVALEAEAKQEGRPHKPLAVGIGINSGIACVGNMGSEQRFDYSVLGDSVNLASRLEGQSKSYGVTIVVGENSAKYVQDFAILEMDLIKVKGKNTAVRIYTLAGDPAVAATGWFKAIRERHNAALAAYRAQRWDDAEAEIAACVKIAEEQTGLGRELTGFYEVLSERIADFRANPPGADWDGVYVATSK